MVPKSHGQALQLQGQTQGLPGWRSCPEKGDGHHKGHLLGEARA